MAKPPKLGAKGKLSKGKLNPDDEGELIITISTEGRNVRIDFGKEVAWMAFPPDEAMRLATAIMERAVAIEGGED